MVVSSCVVFPVCLPVSPLNNVAGTHAYNRAHTEGSILENEVLISTLERLKRDSTEIEAKMKETEEVMDEIHAASSLFQPLAVSCSRLFFALEQAPDLHFLYQFSLEFFFRILDDILVSINSTMHQAEPVEKANALVFFFLPLSFFSPFFLSVFSSLSRSLSLSSVCVCARACAPSCLFSPFLPRTLPHPPFFRCSASLSLWRCTAT